jgi:hypothetical protein
MKSPPSSQTHTTRDEAMSKRPWWLLPPGRLHPLWWVALGSAMLWIDYLSGPTAQFPVMYVLPVALAAWYSGRGAALALAIVVPLLRLTLLAGPAGPAALSASFVFATLFRGTVVIVMALWFARLADLERDLAHRVKALEGLLPICAFCKNIRNEGGEWERLEAFISKRSEAEFSHGVCPSCSEKHYPGVMDE